MKIKKYFIALVVALCFTLNVNAQTTTDFSNVSYSITGITDSSHSGPFLKISGVDFDRPNFSYYLYVSHNTAVPSGISGAAIDMNPIVTGNEVLMSTYFEEAGDVYVTLFEKDGDNYNQATDPVKINRPDQLPIGSRIRASLSNLDSAISIYEPHGIRQKTLNYIIGKITDNSIINAIKNKDSDALDKLLTYSKNQSGAKTGSVVVGITNSIINDMDLEDGEPYYVYFSLNTNNGLYFPIEDVNIYEASVGDSGKFLLNWDDYTIDETTSITSDKLVKNPSTGIYGYVGITLLLIGIGSYIVIKKNKKLS